MELLKDTFTQPKLPHEHYLRNLYYKRISENNIDLFCISQNNRMIRDTIGKIVFTSKVNIKNLTL